MTSPDNKHIVAIYVRKRPFPVRRVVFRDRIAAENAWASLTKDVGTRGIMGATLDELLEDGTIMPVNAAITRHEDGDWFVARAVWYRKRWNRRAQLSTDDPARI